MKLLFWLSPLFEIGSAPVEITLTAEGQMPRSELFPPQPPHSEKPIDPVELVERERAINLYYYM